MKLKRNRLHLLRKLMLLCIFIGFILFLREDKNESSDVPISPTVILYNRVPKCGSSLLYVLLDVLSQKRGTFRYIHSWQYGQYDLTTTEQQDLAKRLTYLAHTNTGKAILYERHFYFFEFDTRYKTDFFYINQLRDPLKRIMSYYDYVRYICITNADREQCALGRRSLENVTLEQCVSTGDPARCLTPEYGVNSSISFFCGQAAVCRNIIVPNDNTEALAIAKLNIERYYAHIGLLEYFESSLELLQFIQPAIFKGILEVYLNHMNSSVVHETPPEYRHGLSSKTRKILLRLLKSEYELYYFVLQRFIDHYLSVFRRMPEITIRQHN